MNLKKYTLLFIVTGILLLWVAIKQFSFNKATEYIKVAGNTQGTQYHITYELKKESENLKPLFENKLHQFDMSLSTYDPQSLISKINNNQTVKTNELFLTCFNEAFRVWEASGGLFDITIAPLATAYGFGPGKRLNPDSTTIDSLLQFVGMEKVRIENGLVEKDHPGITLNVNAIAQGLSVDVICAFLDSVGSKNYMVEIGGELYAKGVNRKKMPWRIGVDKPIEGNMTAGEQIQAIISVENKALATSGNYRKFYEKNGIKYTHTINPKTGKTVSSNLLSATIIADKCITADAFATACMASGLEKAKKLVEENNLEAYFLYSDNNGNIQVWMTEYVKDRIKTNE